MIYSVLCIYKFNVQYITWKVTSSTAIIIQVFQYIDYAFPVKKLDKKKINFYEKLVLKSNPSIRYTRLKWNKSFFQINLKIYISTL